MTTEVLVINETGIAAAADSAATVNDAKVFRTDKLFRICDGTPIGMMTYGSSDISTVSVERIVREYRYRRRGATFPTVVACMEDFLSFIEGGAEPSSDAGPPVGQAHVDAQVLDSLLCLRDIYDEMLCEALEGVPEEDRGARIGAFWAESLGDVSRNLDAGEVDTLVGDIEACLERADADGLGADSIIDDGDSLGMLVRILACRILAFEDVGSETGLVFFGYGSDEMEPAFCDVEVYGVFPNGISARVVEDWRVTAYRRSRVVPFAQTDVVESLLGGFDTRILRDVFKRMQHVAAEFIDDSKGSLSDPSDADILEDVILELMKLIIDTFWHVHSQERWGIAESAVALLPLDDMAHLAEHLVQSTSVRRHITYDLETVGGPVDVAVITRDGGFTWVRRDSLINSDDC